MFATPVRILVVGLTNANTQAMLERWRRSGWGSHTVDSVQEAETVLKTIRFKVILAAENVSDGSGYELARARSAAVRQPFHFRSAFGNLPVAARDRARSEIIG